MTITLNGTTGITNDGGYTGDGISFADTTPSNTLVTTTGGNVGIGTSSPNDTLEVAGANAFIRVNRTGNEPGITFRYNNSSTNRGDIAVTSGGDMYFTSGGSTERMRINSSGYLYVGCTGGYLGDEWQRFSSGSSANNPSATMTVDNASSSPTGLVSFWSFTGATPNNTTARYVRGTDSSGVDKFVIYSNGTISNRTGTYNSLSDLKLKENVVDATPKLDKLMQVQVRNYNLIGDELKQIGFVAQELEQVFPGLVEDVPDFDENQQLTGEVTKMVKTSVLIPILVKAMQEQQAIITDLKARIETLESK